MADPLAYALEIGSLGPSAFRVMSFTGREALNELYTFDVVLVTTLHHHLFERAVMFRRALLGMRVGGRSRSVSGYVSSVSHRGPRVIDGHELTEYAVRIVPRAQRLEHRRGSRIFQDKRVDEVIEEVAEDAGVEVELELDGLYPKREYLTQYEESDLAFLHRLAAENGMLSYFKQPEDLADPLLEALGGAGSLTDLLGVADLAVLARTAGIGAGQGETWVFTDRATYPSIGGGSSSVSVRGGGALSMQDEGVSEAALHVEERPTKVVYRAFDPERPLNPFEGGRELESSWANASSDDAAFAYDLPVDAGAKDLPEPADLVFYDHDARDLFLDWSYAKEEPERLFHQVRRGARVTSGRSAVVRFEPGHRFELENHACDEVNGPYVTTHLEHRGTAEQREGTGGGNAVYENVFRCVPADVVFVAPRPERRAVQVILTAHVVGPEGEEIHTDEQGRVKVKFHWDRSSERAAPSAWLRCMQAWAGAGWGFQFIPRVGMEVVVGFDGGDPDKPMVLGAVYNKILPTPFRLPEEKTTSGIRTRSTPKSGGGNELSFEDAVGKQHIFIHAERDLKVEVQNERDVHVASKDTTVVGGDQHVVVDTNQHVHVKGAREIEVDGSEHTAVAGNADRVVGGTRNETVAKDRLVTVVGQDRKVVVGSITIETEKDLVARAVGHAALAVEGSIAANAEGVVHVRSGSSIVLSAATEILLNVGSSFVRVSESGVEIGAGAIALRAEDARIKLAEGEIKAKVSTKFQIVSDDAVVLKSSGASIGLTSDAKMSGSKVKLGSATDASDDESVESPEPANIELTNADGDPVPFQRYVVKLESGEEITGFLDADGKASVPMEGSGEVSFPDLRDVSE